MGADAVDIDTRASTCELAFAGPTRLDFLAVESAAADAGYVLTNLHLEADGERVEGFCKVCGHEATFLELPILGMRFELVGTFDAGTLIGEVDGWGTDHPRLVPVGTGSARE